MTEQMKKEKGAGGRQELQAERTLTIQNVKVRLLDPKPCKKGKDYRAGLCNSNELWNNQSLAVYEREGGTGQNKGETRLTSKGNRKDASAKNK